MNIKVTFQENNLDMSVQEKDIFDVDFGSGGGTTDYNKLRHKPTINGVILEGDKSSEDLGLLTEADLDTKATVVTKTNGADFLDGADMPMKSLVVNIEPQQDLHGYDAPWAWGNGKNLLDVTQNEEGGINTSGAEVDGNTFRRSSNYIPIKASTSYALWANNGWTVRLYWYDANKTFISPRVEGANGGKAIGTSPANAAYARWSIYNANATITESEVLNSQLQLEAGSTATSFQPYSNICPITGWTGMNGSVVGKNWLPNNLTFTDGLRNDTGTQTTSAFSHYSEPFLVRPNTLYRATGTIWISGTNPRIYFLDANKNWISRTAQFTQQAFNFTTPTNCYYIQVQCSKDVDLTAGMISPDQSAAVTPYNGNTFSVSWETEAGTVYSGTVDPINGTLTVDRVAIDMSTLAVNYDSTYSFFSVTPPNILTPLVSATNVLSSCYKSNSGISDSAMATAEAGMYIVLSNGKIKIKDSRYASASAFRAGNAGQTLCYPITNPQTYQITPTEIRSLLGENHVTVDAGSIESLVYCVDTAAIIERIDTDLASLDDRVDTLESKMDTAQGDITSLETAVEQLDTDIKAVDAKADKKAPAIYSTASGDIASFADGADDMPFKSLVVNIEPVQEGSGDPSPTNIRPISGHTGAEIQRTGKNLYHCDNFTRNFNNITVTCEDGIFTVTGSGAGQIAIPGSFTAIGNVVTSTDKIFVLSSNNIRLYGARRAVSGSVDYPTFSERSWQINAGGGINVLNIQTTADFVGPFTFSFQIELGSEATAYESYQGNSISVDWETEAGTVYGGTLDVTNGVLTVDRALKVLDGTSNVSDYQSFAGSVGYNSGSPQFPNADYSKPILCNKLVTIGPSDSQRFGACKYANVSFYFWFQNEAFTSHEDAKAKVAAANIQCLYYLATPIVHQLSPQQIKTLYAQNHVWTDVGEVSITYPTDTKLYVDNLFASIPTASGVSF